MKRFKHRLVILIFAALLITMTSTAYADDTTITSISFDSIENVMFERNSTILANSDKISSISDQLSSIDSKTSQLQQQLQQQKIYLENIKAAEASLDSSSTTETASIIIAIKAIYDNYIIPPVNSNISSIQAQIDNQSSSKTTAAQSIYKTTIQNSMSNYQLIYNTQLQYLSYNDLDDQVSTMNNSLAQLNSQLKLAQLKNQLGLVTNKDVKQIQSQIKTVNSTIASLKKQKLSIKESLNAAFNQSSDTNLTINSYPDFDISHISNINFNNDYDSSVTGSYSVILQYESYVENPTDDEYDKIDETKAQFKQTMKKAYADMIDKYNEYNDEIESLSDEQDNLKLVQQKYDFGLISKMNLDNENLNLSNEQIKVETARKNLYKSYLKYLWIKKGLSL